MVAIPEAKPNPQLAADDEVKAYLIKQTKTLRLEIDRVYKYINVNLLPKEKNAGRSYAIAVTKLEEAKMWLGKALADVGNVLPEEYRDEAK